MNEKYVEMIDELRKFDANVAASAKLEAMVEAAKVVPRFSGVGSAWDALTKVDARDTFQALYEALATKS